MITYADKVATNPLPNTPDNWVADNANEIKSEVNTDIAALATHLSDTSNPHSVSKSQVGLSNVDNTSDADKPVSTAIQTELDLKQNKSLSINSVSIDTTLALSDAGNVVELTGSNPRTITVPPNGTVAYPTGTVIYLYRTGSGALTVGQGSGVTVTPTASVFTDPGQNIIMTLIKTGTNTWLLQNGVPSLAWTSFTPTLTNVTSSTLNTGGYIIEGKKCTFWVNFAGTVTGTGPITVTNMPAIAEIIWTNSGVTVANTTSVAGRADISAGTTVMTVWISAAQGNFTAGASRQFYIYGWYPIQ